MPMSMASAGSKKASDVGVAGSEGPPTVVFNVSGRHYEVLKQTIRGRPQTKLARLLDDNAGSGRPIFVDANPDRFVHILDWYRLGEIYLPADCPLGGVLCDARLLALPEAVRINGATYPVHTNDTGPDAASDACDVASANIIDCWNGFEDYLRSIVAKVRQDLDWEVQAAKDLQDDITQACTGDFGLHVNPRTRVILSKEAPLQGSHFAARPDPNHPHVWLDKANVCNRQRLQVLVGELAKRGFECNINGGRGGLPLILHVGAAKARTSHPHFPPPTSTRPPPSSEWQV